jgi:hypothetical protein
MIYRLIADTILIIHFCYILFVIFGGLLILRRPGLWKIHIPAVIWGFLVQYFVWICPLTSWEDYFRLLGGQEGYQNGFLDYFLTTLIYPEISPFIHTLLGITILLLNLAIYIYLFFRINKTNYSTTT